MYKKESVESARTLVFVSIIILVIYFAAGLAAMWFIFGIAAVSGQPGIGGAFGILTMITGILFVVGLMWIFLNYFLVYKPLVDGSAESAYTPALILGIVELIVAGVIPGVLLILAYSRIGNAIVYEEAERRKAGV